MIVASGSDLCFLCITRIAKMVVTLDHGTLAGRANIAFVPVVTTPSTVPAVSPVLPPVEQSKDVNSRCPSHVALGSRVDDIIDNLSEIMPSLRLCPKQRRQFTSHTPLHDRRGMIYIRFSVCESLTRPGRLHGRWRLGRYRRLPAEAM
ncbi:hypothetical protein Bcep1808_5859 [Burkholderia vietnamiensis G4]|uniref:Uncharacterized protein n=1 Tax=Burkholderia vietnamiensis (strain G4 / LMG 22486) TaxID=269482 RepID=A4JR85_BURVG|nr:hypothetical protein Bcep1808_5859 [Burkholderia vietnamiensis G4]